MTTPTPAELDELERSYNASTQGEWQVRSTSLKNRWTTSWREIDPFVVSSVEYTSSRDGVVSGVRIDSDDADFIVAAHNAMPALLAAARRCAELEAKLQCAGDWIHSIVNAVGGELCNIPLERREPNAAVVAIENEEGAYDLMTSDEDSNPDWQDTDGIVWCVAPEAKEAKP